MKNKFVLIAIALSLSTSSMAFAQEGKKEENFQNHKPEIIAELNQEKAVIEAQISCINAAQKREDMEKCREQKRASMEKMQQQRMAKKREHLQNELKKLDEEANKSSQKFNKSQPSTTSGANIR